MLIVASVPGSYESVLPLARLVLWYGYISAILATPILAAFRRQFSRKPVAVIPFAGAVGALAAASPFVAAVYNEGVSASDWPSFLGLVPLLAIGAMFGALSGLVFWLIARPTTRDAR
jgi:hypothetical protein